MKDYWLKPDGELIEVSLRSHNEYASNLLKSDMTRYSIYEEALEAGIIEALKMK